MYDSIINITYGKYKTYTKIKKVNVTYNLVYMYKKVLNKKMNSVIETDKDGSQFS